MEILWGEAEEGLETTRDSHKAGHAELVLSDATAEQKQTLKQVPRTSPRAEKAPTAEPAMAWGLHQSGGRGGPDLCFHSNPFFLQLVITGPRE